MFTRALGEVFTFALMLVLGLAGLNSTAAAGDVQHLVVQSGAPVPNITDLPVYVAQEAGFLADEGLQVKVQYGNGGSLAAQLASSGQVQISTNTFEPIIAGYSKGMHGKVFLQVNEKLTYYIAVLQDSNIHQVADLKGVTIGVASKGSTAIPVTEIMLKRAGVDPSTVTFQPVGAGTPAAAAINNGTIKALALWNGAFAAIEGAGTKLRELRDPLLKNYGNGGTWASDKFIAEHRGTVAKYGRALAESLELIRDYPEVATEMYFAVNPEAKKVGLKTITNEIIYVDRDFSRTRPFGQMNLADEGNLIKLYAAVQGISDPPKATDIMTNEFIKEANDFDDSKVAAAARKYKAK
jgi:NitT/TauT family transport system substrate-binding protein